MIGRIKATGLVACAAIAVAYPALSMTAAQDACIDHLRKVGGPDGQGGEVLSSSGSEAGTLVMLRDKGGTTWRCIAYKDGAIGEMSVVEGADDGGGAMAGASGGTSEERVQFAKGTSGADLSGALAPGESKRYLLGAKNEQFLTVAVNAGGPGVFYQIINPDGSFLLDQMEAGRDYRGQLWQSGDHVVEVISRDSQAQSYSVAVGIE